MSIKARYCGSDTTALSDFTSISRIKRAVDSQTGMINLCRRQKRAHLFPGLQGKARPTVPSAEAVWTTAINGNGQQHFQDDTRCILTFLFVLQGKYGQPSHPPRQCGRPPSTATANSIFKVTYVTIRCLSHYLFRSRRRRRHPAAETVWTTAINGNGQQHFQGDIRDDPLPLLQSFLLMLQEKVGKS